MDEASETRERPLFFDLSSRAKFHIRGLDRLRFLNGQTTNDIRLANETQAIESCVLSAKGKIDAHLFISAAPDFFVVDADVELREPLKARLDRYIIADDVEIEDVTEQYCLFHVLDPACPLENRFGRTIQVRRFRETGSDIWVETAERDRTWKALSDQYRLADNEEAEQLRIESGLPRWGRELTNEIIPVEANLEDRCINYSKGCYIGQEVISRMKITGQTNKRLCGLVSLDGRPLVMGMHLRPESQPEREAGWITSATHSSRLGKQIGLGFVKRGFNASGTRLHASLPGEAESGPGLPVQLVELPFG